MPNTTWKTMTIIAVLAMIMSAIAMFPAGTVQAVGAYQVKGTVLDSQDNQPVSGVTVMIVVDSTPKYYQNATTGSDGKFSRYLDITDNYSYNLTFKKTGFISKENVSYSGDTFNETMTPATADTGVTLLDPMSRLQGRILELGTSNGIPNVEVTIKNSTSGVVLDTVLTVIDGSFNPYVDADMVDLVYKLQGYYDNSDEGIEVVPFGTTDVGDIYLEKIVPTPTIKVWGVVFAHGTEDPLEGAVVSISEGNDKWITAVSNENGVYELYAYPGNFQIKASLKGYYTNTTGPWLKVPNEILRDIWLKPTPTETLTLTGTVQDSVATPIQGATVYLYSNDGQYVNHTTTTAAGAYNMMYYDASGSDPANFTMVVMADDYFTYIHPTDISDANDTVADTITLESIVQTKKLHGIVMDKETNYMIEGAMVTIYEKNTHLYSNTTTTGADGNYNFMVHTGEEFVMVVDAEGYQSEAIDIAPLTPASNRYKTVKLSPSPVDTLKVTYTFTNWTTISVTEEKTVNVDNTSVRVNADRKYGMGALGLELNDWTINQNEVDDWEDYLTDRGVEQKDTSDLLLIDNVYYELNETSFTASVEQALGEIIGNTSTIYINKSYTYDLAEDLDETNSSVRTLILNASYDTSILDYIYEIFLPTDPKYEMTANMTDTIAVDVMGYNNPITIDPIVGPEGGTETVTMTLELSMNGTAKAKVTDGLYYVLNNTYDNYTVIVRMGTTDGVDTNVTFNAEDTTDKVGDISKANYTWDFESDGTPDAWGIEVTHNFTTVGQKIVNLTVNETGGNLTYRTLVVKVDSQAPTAGISVDVSDSGNVSYSGGKLTVNEDTPLTFNGMYFTDTEGVAVSDKAGTASKDDISSGDGDGIIEKWYWCWGEEGVSNETVTAEGGNNISHTYSTPGTFTLLMNVTDVVGHVSADATWEVTVTDTTAPEPAFEMRNETDVLVYEGIEDETYTFNASTTVDNHDEEGQMNYSWDFDSDGEIDDTGLLVTQSFSTVGDVNVTLMVTDMAGNTKNLTKTIHFTIGERPDILMKYGSMVFGSESGTVGKGLTISVNLTNNGKVNCSSVTVDFFIRNADGSDAPIGTASLGSMDVYENKTATITWKPSKKGEYSIWANATASGEHDSQFWDNKIDDFDVQKITVNEAAWVVPAIILVVIVVIIAVFFGMRYFMNTRMAADDRTGKRKKK